MPTIQACRFPGDSCRRRDIHRCRRRSPSRRQSRPAAPSAGDVCQRGQIGLGLRAPRWRKLEVTVFVGSERHETVQAIGGHPIPVETIGHHRSSPVQFDHGIGGQRRDHGLGAARPPRSSSASTTTTRAALGRQDVIRRLEGERRRRRGCRLRRGEGVGRAVETRSARPDRRSFERGLANPRGARVEPRQTRASARVGGRAAMVVATRSSGIRKVAGSNSTGAVKDACGRPRCVRPPGFGGKVAVAPLEISRLWKRVQHSADKTRRSTLPHPRSGFSASAGRVRSQLL